MAEPIRILHVLGCLNRGGAETMVLNIYRAIDRSKVQFDFIIHTYDKCDYNDEIRELGGKIYSVPRYTGKNHFEYKKAWNEFFIKHPEYRIVHGHMRSTAAIYLNIAKKYDIVTIAHSHSTASRGNAVEAAIKNFMQLLIRRTADYLFACSVEAGKWLFGKKAIKKNNFMVIKNAIDADKYVFNEKKRNEIRKKLNIKNEFVIGHVGSFSQPKNHKFIVEIFNEINKQNKNVILLLIGDGKLKKIIENQILMFGINDNVILTGVVTNVYDYLQAMDAFLFPSLYEGVPFALIEAQAAGLKIIASDKITYGNKVTNLVDFVSLHESKSYWAYKVLQCAANYERKNMYFEILKAGFDVKENAKFLEEFYLSEYKSK